MIAKTTEPTERRPMGDTGLSISRLGIGGGSLFCRSGDDGSQVILDACWDAGLRLFDTAPYYGRGESEARFGRALQRRPRAEYVMSTKVGHYPTLEGPPREGAGAYDPKNYDYTAARTRESLERSIELMGIGAIDVVMIHDLVEEFLSYDFERRIEEAMTGAYPTLVKMKEEGKIKAIGVAVKDWNVCLRLAKMASFDCFLLAADYNFLRNDSLTEFLPYCERHNIPIMIGAPFCMGILATGAVPNARYFFYKEIPPEIIEKTRRIEAICARHKVPLPAASLQFPLFHPAVANVLVGLQSTTELEQNLAYMRQHIPTDFWADLKEQKIIPENAPTP
ncbi:MAG TPA: aldo/keto reductase [Stellaceae bacterium]|nr:aldo/keto reductase [Stellaceae bacterium]